MWDYGRSNNEDEVAMPSPIIIVDYNTSNIKSVNNMLRKIGVKSHISSDPNEVRKAEKVILPGVGAFDTAMRNLEIMHLPQALNEAVIKKGVPFLGICLGMQILANSSEEGALPGLGWIQGRVQKFNFDILNSDVPKVPHMGWNYVSPRDNDHPLWPNIPRPMRFYFVHSYHLVCEFEENIAAVTSYGGDFVCAVAKDNIWGVQFHPEKSHKYGMQLLRNFVEYV